MDFYSLKHRRTVSVPESVVRRRTLSRATKSGNQERYMLEATTSVDGVVVSLHKFVSRATFDAFREQAS